MPKEATRRSTHLGWELCNIQDNTEWSMAEMAKKMGISRSHLCDIWHGRKSVSVERAVKFARRLGVSERNFVQCVLQQQLDDAKLSYSVNLVTDGTGFG